MDEQALTRGQPAAFEDVGPHREEGFRDGARGDDVQPFRDRQALDRRSGTVFGVAAPCDERAHAIAHMPSVDAARDGHDRSGDLEPRDVGGPWRGRVTAEALHHVRPIDARRLDLDEDFPCGRVRNGPLDGAEHFRPAGPLDLDCRHHDCPCHFRPAMNILAHNIPSGDHCMTTRSVTFSVLIMALAGAVASGPVVAQETTPKPPAPQTTKPKPPPQTAKPKPPAPQTAKPKPATPAAKPGTKPATAGGGGAGPTAAVKARLRSPGKLKDVAPATFKAQFDTSAGPFVVEVHRDWSPIGADRFYNLVKYGFFDGVRFFRVIPNFMVQFGINGDPSVQSAWRDANLQDDPVKQSNKRGFITFAKTGAPNSRSTQVFINFRDNAGLDRQGFSPFGEVISGMEVVDKINPQYRRRAKRRAATHSDAGECVPEQGVSEARLHQQGDDREVSLGRRGRSDDAGLGGV